MKITSTSTLQALLVLSFLSFGAGCARNQGPDVTTHYQTASGFRTDLLSNNLLQGEAPDGLWLNAARVFRNFRDYDLFLEVRYQAPEQMGLLDIRPGHSLEVIADGQELRFRGSGSGNRRQQEAGYVAEEALYPVTESQLRAIAAADTVEVHVTGGQGKVRRPFGPENTDKFRTFVARLIEAPRR
jgi:hypothetical protein